MSKAVCLLVLCIAIGGAAYGQDDWFQSKPIESIRFIGLSNVSETVLLGITEQFIGEKFQNNLFFESLGRSTWKKLSYYPIANSYRIRRLLW